jgi:hypothetical protein
MQHDNGESCSKAQNYSFKRAETSWRFQTSG